MTLIRRPGANQRSTAGVLADIAHELSSTSNWQTRVQDALSMVCDIIPSETGALGVHVDGWSTYFCTNLVSTDEIEEILQEHYQVLTGSPPEGDENNASAVWNTIGVIADSECDKGSFLSLPVIGAGQVIGVLHVCIDKDDAYTPEDVSILSIVALQIGSYIINITAQAESQLRIREIGALRDEAERRRSELESFISSTTDGVLLFDIKGNTLMINDAGRRVLGYPVDEPFADWAGKLRFYTLDGHQVSLEETAPMKALGGEAIRDTRYRLVTQYGKEISLGISASPVRDSAGQIVGVVNVFRDISEETKFQQQRQELFEREHHISQMLQQALIPPQVEFDLEGARIAVKYQPALKEAEVGGDFYDIFKLGDGLIGILIGDVAGKGLQAAIQVAEVRYAVRSYAYLDWSPSVVMTLVNEMLCRDEPGGGALLTAIYAVLDTKECTVTYASGGHEPPLMRRKDGQIEELSLGGRALGVYGGYTYAETSRRIKNGETLVVVTDGITEARCNNMLFGPERVREFLTSHAGLCASETASGLLDAATAHAGGALQDDAAIVVVEVK